MLESCISSCVRERDGWAVSMELTPSEVTVGRVAGGLSYLVVEPPHSLKPRRPWGTELVAAGQQEWKHTVTGHWARESPCLATAGCSP